VYEVAGKGGEGELMEHQMSSREFGGFLQRVTMVWVSSLHLFSHSGWSLRKMNS
jgi:hypothetical protein